GRRDPRPSLCRDGRPRPGAPAVPRSGRTDGSVSRGAVRRVPRLTNTSILCVPPMLPQIPRAYLLWNPEPIGPAPLSRGRPARRARVPRFGAPRGDGPRSRGPIGTTGQGP